MPRDKDVKSILIVEDEKAMGHALAVKLEKAGFVVDVVMDGQAAMKATQEKQYQLVLLDLMLPQINGFELLSHWHSQEGKLPIFIVSNLSQEEDMKRAKQLGAEQYFVKSDTPLTHLVAKIEERLM